MPPEPRSIASETLEQLLARVRLESAFYFSVNARAPWATLTPHMNNIGHIVMPDAQRILPFHIMLDGEAYCWRVDEPENRAVFKTGDILFLPNGCDHVIASGCDPRNIPTPDAEIYREAERSRRPCTYVDLGGEGEKANFVCGYFGAPKQSFNPLFESLPDLLVLSPSAEKQSTLKQLIQIATEQQADRLTGGRLVASRLAETVFVDAIHEHLLSEPKLGGSGWTGALGDPNIGRALRAIHADPTGPWTVERLARISGLSRSGFAERFRDLIGSQPIAYVQNWRLQIAANDLAQTDQPLKQIAAACGYQSETAFHRAFKNRTGITPGAWRALHAPST